MLLPIDTSAQTNTAVVEPFKGLRVGVAVARVFGAANPLLEDGGHA